MANNDKKYNLEDYIENKMEITDLIGSDRAHFVEVGGSILRLDLEELDEELLKISKETLGETPETVERGMEQLKDLLSKEEGLYVPLEDRTYLMKFLRPNHFSAERAFKMMKNYYKFKMDYPKYCSNLRPKALQKVFEANVLNILPNRTPLGERIVILHCGKLWDPSEVSLCELYRALMMVLEIAMIEPKTQLGGVHVILDHKGLSLHHIMQFTPSFARALLTFIQECAPIRQRGIFNVNQPYIFNMLFAIFKPFIGEKLKKRLHFVGTNYKQMHQFIPPECLPVYYGGKIEFEQYPGALMGELLCHYDNEFELCETIGYTKAIERKDG